MNALTSIQQISVLLYIIIVVCSGFSEKFDTTPFITIWNAPSWKCEHEFGIKLNLSYFDIVANTGDTFQGDEIVIFYKNRLGLYPWITQDGTFVNGGLPQMSNLTEHIRQVSLDITRYIPDINFTGLAVIDWESWRPIFDRNNYNDVMKVYIRASESLIRKKHPDWSDEKIHNEAKKEFENGARDFMQTTLTFCRHLRPRGFWGFYGFPNCYNYKPGQIQCSDKTLKYNNELWWLFNTSTALLPSIYLSEDMGTHKERYDRVTGELRETLRTKALYGGQYTSLVTYSRFRYGDTGNFYDTVDLESTIQQAAETGYNGVALWDSSASFRTREQCESVRQYLDDTLGPFVKNISNLTTKCSRTLCNLHGRCVKGKLKANKKEEYEPKINIWMYNIFKTMCKLITNLIFSIVFKENTEKYQNRTQVISVHPLDLPSVFHCSCYKGWTGNSCDRKVEQYI